jgi:hypothetical protein
MCKECELLEKKISHFRGFLTEAFDPLTIDRIRALILDLEKRRAELHYESSAL